MTSKTNNISKDVGCGSDRVFRTISTVLHTEVSKTIVKGWGYRIQYKGCFHKKKGWFEYKTGGLQTPLPTMLSSWLDSGAILGIFYGENHIHNIQISAKVISLILSSS